MVPTSRCALVLKTRYFKISDLMEATCPAAHGWLLHVVQHFVWPGLAAASPDIENGGWLAHKYPTR